MEKCIKPYGTVLLSENYEKFAQETYETVYNAVQQSLATAKNAPILMVSGEGHYDFLSEIITNMWTDDAEETPAHAAAYTHISAIRAAADLVGRENVVVSFEQDPKSIENILSNLNRDRVPDFFLEPQASQLAFIYAYKNGFNIVGTDAGYRGAIERADGNVEEIIMDPQRYAMEHAAISAQAGNARIVVHIGGAAHIKTLQGYPPDSDFSDPDNVPTPVDNPFDSVYGCVVYFNNDDEFKKETEDTSFYRNPENAIQIDAPGKMDSRDRKDVGKRIDDAAATMRSEATTVDIMTTPSRPKI